jgi:hypothetical protein
LRFSTPEQRNGDSLRRQREYRDAWLKRHPDVTLDTSLRLTDSATGPAVIEGDARVAR